MEKNRTENVYSAIPLNDDVKGTTNTATRSGSIRVQVEAPAALAEGYKFLATYRGRLFSITVPPGGVQQGQKIEFLAPVEERADESTTSTFIAAATGRWKDGLFGCFNNGICSAHLWCALCCRACALGQIMQRLGLSCMANPVPEEKAKRTFITVFFIFLSQNLFSFYPVGAPPIVDEEGNFQMITIFLATLQPFISILLLIWCILALTKTRAHVRANDNIPEEQCHGCEDLCCALFCSCCTVAQLDRHTEEMDPDHRPVMPPSNTSVVIEAVGIV